MGGKKCVSKVERVPQKGEENTQVLGRTASAQPLWPRQMRCGGARSVIGSGSFGIVYQAVCTVTKETVAIKKVLEDRRYKVGASLHACIGARGWTGCRIASWLS